MQRYVMQMHRLEEGLGSSSAGARTGSTDHADPKIQQSDSKGIARFYPGSPKRFIGRFSAAAVTTRERCRGARLL